jgi:cobalt/nickel transport protein
MSGMPTRLFAVLVLAVTLLVAGGVSYYASEHPDGLEYVAGQVGFGDAAEESPTAGSPLAGYRLRGVEDDRASTAVAGVVGAFVVLLLAGGLGLALRRRGPAGQDGAAEERASRVGRVDEGL